jgi:hypothetical protein
MRRFPVILMLVLVWVQAVLAAAEFKLTNGDVLKGEPAQITSDGMVVRLEVGGFSDRVGWARFTQESLKSLLDNPQAKKFVEPFIEVPIEEKRKERAKKLEIGVVKDPETRLERPPAKARFFPGLITPAGFMVLGLFMAANLYAAFRIAQFRARPVPLVVGVSLIFPVLGPIIFLLTPDAEGSGPPPLDGPAPATDQEVVSAQAKVPGMQSSLGLQSHQKPAKAGGEASAQVFRRADTTFDRRFFETKFTGFFRVVPENSDMVLVVKTGKQEYVARRISRISANEVHLQLIRGNTEVSVTFGEIAEVQVRHKDAKG